MSQFPTEAVCFHKKLHGSSQAILTRCSDGYYYAVKFSNNPNGVTSLAREVVISRLARLLSLPVPEYSLVFVSDWLVRESSGFVMISGERLIRYQAGIQFGSLTPYSSIRSQFATEYPPSRPTDTICNIDSFAGMLLFDLWTGRSGTRQVLFLRSSEQQRHYRPLFIDHGLNLHELDPTTTTIPPICGGGRYYGSIRGWGSFEPWLTRIEELDDAAIENTLKHFPDEWGISEQWKEIVVHFLILRRATGRAALSSLRGSEAKPFPNWGKSPERTRATADDIVAELRRSAASGEGA
jgi:hypothetical protein